MTASVWSHRLLVLGWAGIGFAACMWMIPLEPNLVEEGFHLHAAQRLLRGERLYRDIALFTGPLPAELLALAFRIFGEEISVGRTLVAVANGGACAALYALALRAGAGVLAHLAAAVLAAAPVLLFPLLTIYFYSTLLVYLTVIVGYMTLRGVASLRWCVAAGVAVAGVALFKQPVGLVLALALMIGLAVSSTAEQRRSRVLALLGGGAGMALATLGFYLIRGDLAALVNALVVVPLSFGETYSSSYMNFWPPGRFSPELRPHQGLYLPSLYTLIKGFALAEVGRPLVLLTQLLYGLPFIALALTALRLARSGGTPGLWMHTAVLLALAMNLFPRPDWGHLAFVLPATVVQLVLLLPGPPLVRRISALVLGVALATGALQAGRTLHGLAGPPSFGPRVPQRPVSAMYRGSGLPRVIGYLRSQVSPGEPIFVARQEPLIYFATGTTNPTPYGGLLAGLREPQETALLEGLEKVRYVVISEIDQPKFLYYRDELPAVQAYFERHFRLPPAFRGRRASWILVLERGPDRGATAVDLIARRSAARAWLRDAEGKEREVRARPPKLATRQNRRPLAFFVGQGGGGIDFELELPAGAVFQADVGLDQLLGISAVYRHPRRATLALRISEGGPFETLASRSLSAPEHDPSIWTPLEADLSGWGRAGRRVTLRLELTPQGPMEPGTLAWWGSPRLALPPGP